MECMWCNEELGRGRHFLCNQCLTKISEHDLGTLAAFDTFFDVVSLTTTKMLDDADLRRDVKERLKAR